MIRNDGQVGDCEDSCQDQKKTYVGKDTHHVEGTTALVEKVDVGLETTLGTQEGHVTGSVDGGPANNGGPQPAMQGNDLRVGEADGVEHGAAEDQEQDHATASNNSVTTGITDLT